MNINRYLPKIALLIDNAEEFERNQMICAVERACLDSHIALSDMTDDDKNRFENNLIEKFKFNYWIKGE
jgi:hypothetical protein